jgi:hypothetical protein
MHVAVVLGASDNVIAGAQFSVQYDPAGLDFLSIEPGEACSPMSPFSAELSQSVDESQGTVFYSVGIGLDQLPGTSGPAVVACLTFNVLDRARSEVCSFMGVNPLNTYVVDQFGQIVSVFNGEDCPTEQHFPIISCVDYLFCPIPVTSEWGLLILTLSFAIGAKVLSRRRAA